MFNWLHKRHDAPRPQAETFQEIAGVQEYKPKPFMPAKLSQSEKERLMLAFKRKAEETKDSFEERIDKDWDFRGEPEYSSAQSPSNVPRHSMDEGEIQAYMRGISQGYRTSEFFLSDVLWGKIEPQVLQTNRTGEEA